MLEVYASLGNEHLGYELGESTKAIRMLMNLLENQGARARGNDDVDGLIHYILGSYRWQSFSIHKE